MVEIPNKQQDRNAPIKFVIQILIKKYMSNYLFIKNYVTLKYTSNYI